MLNEIYTDEAHRFGALNGLTYAQIKEQSAKGVAAANTFLEALAEYELTIVKLTGAERPEEFNLQFTRLNLGTIINSGEKLNAMVGDMRDVCFDETGLGQHRFLAGVKIPTRRYSKEQTTAQILAHVFSIKQTGDYTRTRHFDLQRFFKEHVTLADVERGWIDGLRATFDRLADAFEDLTIIRNRAITVSTALLAWKLELGAEEADEYAEFIEQFVCRLNWQVAKGLEMDNEYRYLMDFQRHVTQASVEKPAVKARAEFLETQYQSWLENQQINGDAQYIDNSHRDPSNDCQSNA